MEVDQPPTVELQKSLPSTSAGVKSTFTTSATHSAVETSAGGDSVVESHKPTYTEKLQCSPAMRPKAVVSKPGNLGAPYTGEEREARLMHLVKRSEKISFVDTHFHLNRLQEASHIESLEEILVSGPILLTLIELEYAIPNFIDGVLIRRNCPKIKGYTSHLVFIQSKPTNTHQKKWRPLKQLWWKTPVVLGLERWDMTWHKVAAPLWTSKQKCSKNSFSITSKENYGKLFWSSIAEICRIQLRPVITAWMQWRVYCPMRNEVHTEFIDTAIMEGWRKKMPGYNTIQTQSLDSLACCSRVIVIQSWTRLSSPCHPPKSFWKLTLHIFYHPYSVNIGTIHHTALMEWLGELPSWEDWL